jgi:hypothetical protein
MPHIPANWLCASTLTLLLLATICTGVQQSCSQWLAARVPQDPINLGSAESFGALAHTTVTNTVSQ